MNEFEENDDLTVPEVSELDETQAEVSDADQTEVRDGESAALDDLLTIPPPTNEPDLAEFPEELDIKIGENRLHTVMMQTQPVD